MATTVRVVESGGRPVTESTNGLGFPMTPSEDFGMPVTIVASGGMPVIFISDDFVLLPGGGTEEPGVLAANRGTFTLTGRDGSFIVARTLVADAGAFTLTGVAAGTLVHRPMTAAAGTFTLTGVNTTLTHEQPGAYVLTAAPGTFTLAGLEAHRAYNITSSAGAFTLTGVAATLSTSAKTMAADAGTFTFTGVAATLTYTPVGGSASWNSADKAAAIVLSNSDLTATHSGGGAYSYGNVRGFEITGKKVFSAVVSYSSDGQAYVGIAPSTAGLTTQQVSQVGQNSIVCFLESGVIRQNGSYAGDFGNAAAAPSGTRVTIIVDTVSGTKKVWFAKNNTIDGDPAAGTGGFTFTGSMYPLFGGYRGGGAVSAVASFADDGSGFTLPTGFTWVA